jgi:predicted nucleic acid-binding protein
LERPKFKFSPLSIDRILITFTRFGEFVNPEFTLAVSRHEPDNRFLECAEAAGANYLITGNLRHYPSQHGVTRIVRAPTFLSETQFLFQL